MYERSLQYKITNFGLIVTGLPAPMPDFMRKKRKSKCPSPVIPSDSDSDEEWKPSKVKAKGNVLCKRYPQHLNTFAIIVNITDESHLNSILVTEY